MRPLVLATILLLPGLAGCAAPGEPGWMIAALDGRWSFDVGEAGAALGAGGIRAPEGALVLDEAIVQGARPALADVVGLDARAADALGVALPPPGELVLSAAAAQRAGVAAGERVAVHAHASPPPSVAQFFEMERVRACERDPEARLCFLPQTTPGEARLRLRAVHGARDAAFLPDLVELGPHGTPAWWNGTFVGPDGNATPFSAHASTQRELRPAELLGPMAPGAWTITFTLEANGTRTPAGAAGIVRVREPGFLWFDDRLSLEQDARAMARTIVQDLTPTMREMRVARVDDALPMGAGALLALDDARALAGVGADEATALLVRATPTDAARLDAERGSGGLESALRLRALPAAREARPDAGALVFAARDAAAAEGAGAWALAGRAPVGEEIALDGAPLPSGTILLSPAGGELPWTMPAGARWDDAERALENVSRSRTLALLSNDLLANASAAARLQIGAGNTSRALVAVGSVEGGPAATAWVSAAFVAGSGKPLLPRAVVPVAQGEDRAALVARWEADGFALDA